MRLRLCGGDRSIRRPPDQLFKLRRSETDRYTVSSERGIVRVYPCIRYIQKCLSLTRRSTKTKVRREFRRWSTPPFVVDVHRRTDGESSPSGEATTSQRRVETNEKQKGHAMSSLFAFAAIFYFIVVCEYYYIRDFARAYAGKSRHDHTLPRVTKKKKKKKKKKESVSKV